MNKNKYILGVLFFSFILLFCGCCCLQKTCLKEEKMKTILETDRLILRNFFMEDDKALLEIFADGGMPHMAQFGPLDIDYARGFLNRMIENYQNYGFGLWAVIEKKSGNLIGYCGIHKVIVDDNIEMNELAYRINKKLWGNGFATEAAIAVQDYAFNVLNLSEIVSCIAHENSNSIRVAQKGGLTYWRDGIFKGKPCKIYRKVRGHKMVDLKKLDESIEIVKYNPEWPKQFAQESENIKNVFSKDRLLGLEHYGSTSVPGLSAKPIVDILVGLDEFKLLDDEIKRLENLGYEFVGQLHPQVERFFLRKRGALNFNLGVLKFGSPSWFDHLNTRDYLIAHPEEVKKYENVKQEAINRGFKTLVEYHKFKDEFVKGLNERAKLWSVKKMSNMLQIIDLTQKFTALMPVHKYDDQPTIKKIRNLKTNQYNDWQIVSGMHVGTHIDGPGHFTENKTLMSDMPIDNFVGKGYLIDARNKPIDINLLANMPKQEDLIVLILTGFDKKFGTQEYFENHPIIPVEFAEELVKRKIKMVGIDFFSPDVWPFPTHKIFFQNNILIIENLTNLEKLLNIKNFKVIALPIRTETDSALARVIAIVE